MIRSLMRQIFPSELAGSADATANVIRRLASPCPACGKGRLERGDGHEYALIATEVAGGPSVELSRFFKLYTEHEWVELNRIQRFDGTANAAEVFALRCKTGITMLAVRAPAELYDSDSLLRFVVLDQAESAAVESLPIAFRSV
jgi:hypothetical protein